MLFKTADGNEYALTINIGAIKRVRDIAGVDLFTLADPSDGGPPLATRLFTDPVLLGQIIAAIVYPQLHERGVTAEAFAEQMDARAVVQAQTALVTQLRFFFEGVGRHDLATVAEEQLQLAQILSKRIAELLGDGTLSTSTRRSSVWTLIRSLCSTLRRWLKRVLGRSG